MCAAARQTQRHAVTSARQGHDVGLITMSNRTARDVAGATFSLGCAGSLIQAVAHPSGWLWLGARVVVFVIFVIAAVLWLIAALRDRHTRRPRNAIARPQSPWAGRQQNLGGRSSESPSSRRA
jgi:hypothetical protein